MTATAFLPRPASGPHGGVFHIPRVLCFLIVDGSPRFGKFRNRMGVTDQLKTGLSLGELRAMLRGWREESPSAVLAPNTRHLFYTIEFRPLPTVPSIHCG
jgi:hypothetical protein